MAHSISEEAFECFWANIRPPRLKPISLEARDITDNKHRFQLLFRRNDSRDRFYRAFNDLAYRLGDLRIRLIDAQPPRLPVEPQVEHCRQDVPVLVPLIVEPAGEREERPVCLKRSDLLPEQSLEVPVAITDRFQRFLLVELPV